MRTVTASEFQKNFGAFKEIAQREVHQEVAQRRGIQHTCIVQDGKRPHNQ